MKLTKKIKSAIKWANFQILITCTYMCVHTQACTDRQTKVRAAELSLKDLKSQR